MKDCGGRENNNSRREWYGDNRERLKGDEEGRITILEEGCEEEGRVKCRGER